MTAINSVIVITFVLLVMALLNCEGIDMQIVRVTGYVKASYDEHDNLLAVDLQMEDDSHYCITLDDKGWEFGEYYDDQWVEVTGVLSQKDDESWITIESFRAEGDIENEGEELPEDEDPWPDEGYG